MNKKLLLVSSLLVLGSVIFTNNKVNIKAQLDKVRWLCLKLNHL